MKIHHYLLLGTVEQVRHAVLITYGPRVAKVINCESGFKQFRADGSLLISPTNDIGIGQINIPTWDKTAKKMGYDLKNARDNFNFIAVVLEKQGIGAYTCDKMV